MDEEEELRGKRVDMAHEVSARGRKVGECSKGSMSVCVLDIWMSINGLDPGS